MLHNLFSASIVGNGSESGRVSQATCNGIVLTCALPFTNDQELTITKRGAKSIVLVNGISLRKLASYAEIEGGVSASVADIMGNTSEGTAIIGTNQIHAMAIDLGCLHLGANNETLEVRIHNRAGSVYQVSCASFYDRAGTEECYKIYESSDTKDIFGDAEAIYMVAADFDGALTMDELDLNILVTANGGSDVHEFEDAAGYTACRGQVDFATPTRGWKIYQSPEDIHDSVDVQITGPDAHAVTLLSRTSVHDPVATSKAAIYVANDLASRLERMDSQKARSLRRAGKFVKPAVLRRMAARGNLAERASRVVHG